MGRVKSVTNRRPRVHYLWIQLGHVEGVLCGISSDRHTTDWRKVTCQRCFAKGPA
ncbi:MAG: hypothetical protein AAF211_22295 [Myxococcota bacterium]